MAHRHKEKKQSIKGKSKLGLSPRIVASPTMDQEEASNVTREQTPAPAQEREAAPAFQLMMLFGATAIIGAAAEPVPWPRLLFALLAWFVGCLSLFTTRA
jgi:hypothetical protein